MLLKIARDEVISPTIGWILVSKRTKGLLRAMLVIRVHGLVVPATTMSAACDTQARSMAATSCARTEEEEDSLFALSYASTASGLGSQRASTARNECVLAAES